MQAPFDVPPGLHFTCSRCGDCCRSWNVPVDPGESERLGRLDWRGRADDLVGIAPTIRTTAPPFEGQERLVRREDGSCLYLGAENQCRIHEHFGESAKPMACRSYPFAFRATGGRIAVDVAFSCRAVSLGTGAPVETHAAEWSRLIAESPVPAEAEHSVARGRPLPGDILRELEGGMVTLLGQRSTSLLDRVRACLLYAKLATTGDPATPAAAALRDGILKGIARNVAGMAPPEGMDATQRVVFWSWLFLALNPVPAGFHESPGRQQREETSRRVAAGERFRDRTGRPHVDGRELSVTFADIRRVDAAPVLRDRAGLVAAFLVAKVIGQRFLVGHRREIPFVEAVPRLFLALPMALWTAQALAADRGGTTVEEPDLRRALRLVDRTLGQLQVESLPRKQADACRHVFTETDIVLAATHELVSDGGHGAPGA